VFFKKTELISDLIVIYTNLSEIEAFCKAVVRDERSFRLEYLQKAHRQIKINNRLYDLSPLEKFIANVPAYQEKESELEELIANDAPDEFFCPISCELMKDPVLLPTSGNICDRNTMKRILLK